MKTGFASYRFALFAIGALHALLLDGSAQAQNNGAEKAAAHNEFYAIDAMALTADGNQTGADFFNSWGNGLSTTNLDGCFNAGVNLPHGAIITKINAWASSEDSAPEIYLLRKKLSGEGNEFIATNIPTKDKKKRNAVLTPDPALAKVDNAQYSYGFGICISKGVFFRAARITYTVRE